MYDLFLQEQKKLFLKLFLINKEIINMKQVILIKWWETKENYKDFYDYLEKEEFDPYKEETKRWNRNLSTLLWDDFKVITISMPNRHFADYKAWKIMFEKVIPYLKDDVIFIWHSLGWSFLSKYFNEEQNKELINKIKKIILVAPAFKDNKNELLWTFNFDKNLDKLKQIQDKIAIFASKDDFIVPFDDIQDLQKTLNKSNFKIFENKWHFLDEDFDELVEYVKKV